MVTTTWAFHVDSQGGTKAGASESTVPLRPLARETDGDGAAGGCLMVGGSEALLCIIHFR